MEADDDDDDDDDGRDAGRVAVPNRLNARCAGRGSGTAEEEDKEDEEVEDEEDAGNEDDMAAVVVAAAAAAAVLAPAKSDATRNAGGTGRGADGV